ncbi:60S acidic ribosomal protein P1 [Balamuthia mandrillaris]
MEGARGNPVVLVMEVEERTDGSGYIKVSLWDGKGMINGMVPRKLSEKIGGVQALPKGTKVELLKHGMTHKDICIIVDLKIVPATTPLAPLPATSSATSSPPVTSSAVASSSSTASEALRVQPTASSSSLSGRPVPQLIPQQQQQQQQHQLPLLSQRQPSSPLSSHTEKPIQLTTGIIQAFHSSDSWRQPTLQVVSVSKPSPGQCRLLVTDGVHQTWALLAASVIHMADALVPTSVIQVQDVTSVANGSDKLMIILAMQILAKQGTLAVASPVRSPTQSASSMNAALPRSFEALSLHSKPSAPLSTPVGNNLYPVLTGEELKSNGPSFKNPATTSPSLASSSGVLLVKDLNPLLTKWTFRGEVLSKSPVRTYANAQRSGKLFSMILADSQQEKIETVCFNDEVDKWFSVIDVGKTYTISGGVIKPANPKFCKTKLQIVLDARSTVQGEQDAREHFATNSSSNSSTTSSPFNPVPLIDILSKIDADEYVNCAGVIVHASDLQSLKTKAGKALKREVVLTDQSNSFITVTLWGEKAKSSALQVGDIFYAQAVRVTSFQGKGLSSAACTVLLPETMSSCPYVLSLKQWAEQQVRGVSS